MRQSSGPNAATDSHPLLAIQPGLLSRAPPVIAQQIPSLFIRRPVILQAVSIQRDRGPFRTDDQSPRNDEPNVFKTEIGRQKIKVSPFVKFAPGARMDAANISSIGLTVCG
jgi:hypothetical protein